MDGMKAKLIKVGSHYDLYHRIAEEDLIIGFASTDNTFEKKLSLKNCQSIEQQLQTQRMWDVEIEMWFHGTRHKKGEWIPKLDIDECLILKLKSEENGQTNSLQLSDLLRMR